MCRPRATRKVVPTLLRFSRFLLRLLARVPRASRRLIDAKNDLSALMRLAREHFVGCSGLGKRQHIADACGQFTGLDERPELFEALGRDVDENEERPHTVAESFLLIGLGHGRYQDATALQDGEG